jgi:hypothetical protein
MIGAGLLGLMFTGVYLISGSLLLPIILHTAQDLVALLLARPGSPQEAPPKRAIPVEPTPSLIRPPVPPSPGASGASRASG